MTAPLRPADLRRLVREWIILGAAVIIKPDGTIQVMPAPQQPTDPFDLVDMKQ
jgi:hypothetical protein